VPSNRVDERLHRLQQRLAPFGGELPQRLHGRLADAARRRVEDPIEADVIGRVRQDLEVSEDVLDLAPVVEADRSEDPIRDPRLQHRLLEEPRLRVRAVEHRALGNLNRGGEWRSGATRSRLVAVGVEAAIRMRSPRGSPRTAPCRSRSRLLPTTAEARQNVAGGAVVALQLDHRAPGVLLEAEDVAEIALPRNA
jgi:hypothetical protein